MRDRERRSEGLDLVAVPHKERDDSSQNVRRYGLNLDALAVRAGELER
jgi:hypothetical protein